MKNEITRPDYLQLAQQICAEHRSLKATQLRFAQVGRKGIERAIAIGKLLIDVQEKTRGEFDEWLAAYAASLEDFPQRSWCYAWKSLAKRFPSIDDVPPDIATINAALRVAGLIGTPNPLDPPEATERPLFSLRFQLPERSPSEWPAEERREFLTRAKPVVDLYAAAQAIESAS